MDLMMNLRKLLRLDLSNVENRPSASEDPDLEAELVLTAEGRRANRQAAYSRELDSSTAEQGNEMGSAAGQNPIRTLDLRRPAG